MAYESKYEVRTRGEIDLAVLADALEELTGFSFFNFHGTLSARLSWYEHVSHMTELTLRFPAVTFCVTRYGEDSDDVWRYFYKHGHEPVSQRARLTFNDAPLWAEATP